MALDFNTERILSFSLLPRTPIPSSFQLVSWWLSPPLGGPRAHAPPFRILSLSPSLPSDPLLSGDLESPNDVRLPSILFARDSDAFLALFVVFARGLILRWWI
ncbi:hypothetical protein FRC15_003553 [Serendipita sp. 397]|nr:hypothetical protein FRC15_003553 [Serendipita sp. 397]